MDILEFPAYIKKKFRLNNGLDMAYGGSRFESVFIGYIYTEGISRKSIRDYTNINKGTVHRIDVSTGPFVKHCFASLDEFDEFYKFFLEKLWEDKKFSKDLLNKIETALENIEHFAVKMNKMLVSSFDYKMLQGYLRDYFRLYKDTIPYSYLWYDDFRIVRDICERMVDKNKDRCITKKEIEKIISSDNERLFLEQENPHAGKMSIEDRKIYEQLDEHEKELVLFFKRNYLIKTLKKKILNECELLMEPFFKAIGQMLCIDIEDLYFLTPQEILVALEKGSDKEVREKILLRRKRWSIILIDGKITVLSSKDFPLVIEEKHDLKKMNGISAYKGKVNGRIRVVKTYDDVKIFNEGEILAAKETSLKYIEAIKKARAIVTESGGILSHPAIISREFKIPTIMNLAGLLRNVNTGDFVQVDADKGILHIIREGD